MSYRISDPARLDIDGIWDYIASDNPDAARKFVIALGEQFSMLDDHPKIGRACERLREGARRITLGNYVIFYRINSDHIEIARVLHGARDIDAILGESESD